MKKLLITAALAALGSFNCQAQSNLKLDNMTPTMWSCEYYATSLSTGDVYQSATMAIPSNNISVFFGGPAHSPLQWQTRDGHPIPIGGLPGDTEWSMMRIWNPCGITGISGHDVIWLSTGAVPGTPGPTNAVAPTPFNCPANPYPQLDGQFTIPGPGELRLTIQ